MKKLIEFLEKRGLKTQADSLKDGETLLELIAEDLGESGAKELAEALKYDTYLTQLKLHRNGIGDTGATAFAAMLKTNSTLKKLDLSCNNIGNIGATELATVLKTNSTLTKLDLGWNYIRKIGAKELSIMLKINSTIKMLNLINNEISKTGIKELTTALKTNFTLTRFDLNGNKIETKELEIIDKHLQRNKSIAGKKVESLNMEGNNFNEAIEEDVEQLIEQQTRASYDVIINKVEEIIYDKPLLNHPKLLQAAVDNKLSSNLIHEAINNNDEELILAGVLSMGYDVTLIN